MCPFHNPLQTSNGGLRWKAPCLVTAGDVVEKNTTTLGAVGRNGEKRDAKIYILHIAISCNVIYIYIYCIYEDNIYIYTCHIYTTHCVHCVTFLS